MTATEIINELKNLGLDPAQPDIGKLDDNRIFALMNELGQMKGDEQAASYLLAMNQAINQMDSLGYVKNQGE